MTPLTVLLFPALMLPGAHAPIVIRHDKAMQESIELARRFDAAASGPLLLET